jgi:Tol biopolymer transport system component/tRNA A-37 threonylcarbamoyl transferase component Bud32
MHMIGKTISHYRIIEMVGVGGMGEVYRAHDSMLGRVVALKRPRQSTADSRVVNRRLIAEARASSKLLHPNITTVFEVLEDGDTPWLVMEFVEGQSLRDLIDQHGAITIDQVLVHSEGLADGLRLAHENGVLHRDINPRNILMGTDGRARLTDFGLAKAFAERPASEDSSTETLFRADGGSRAVGTRGYAAPEQTLGRKTDVRSDIFSLGLVLYEMSTGRRAFNSDGGDWLDRLLHREPEPISTFLPDAPPEFERIVRKAIAKRPDERYQNAEDLLTDLRALRRRIESGSDSAPASGPSMRPLPSRWRRTVGIGSLTAFAVIALSSIFWVAALRNQQGPSLEWKHRQLTSAGGWQGEPAVSPNGQLIAYVSEQSGDRALWVIDAGGGGQPLRLTTRQESVRTPTWYPDGSTIAFVATHNGTSVVWRIPALGGTAVPVISDAIHPAISPDGRQIAFARENPSGFLRIWVAPIDDTASAKVITSDDTGLWSHRHPAWSPDGSKICYADFKDLWVISADGTGARRMTHDRQTSRHPRWWPTGRFIVHSSLRQGSSAIWKVPSEKGQPVRLSLGTGTETAPSVAADGSRIAYQSGARQDDLVLIDPVTGARVRLESASQESTPAVAPDGSAVVFVSDRGGQSADLWKYELEEGRPIGEPERLTAFAGSTETPSFSADGMWVAFFRVTPEGHRDIWVVSAAGGEPVCFCQDPGHDIHPAFSPDGRWLAFASDRGGTLDIWIAPFDSGRRAGPMRQITHGPENDMFPTWSPDGRSIAFHRNHAIWAADLESSGEARKLTGYGLAQIPKWRSASLGLLTTGSWDGNRLELRMVTPSSEHPVPFDPALILGDTETPAVFDVSADGSIIVALESELDGDVWLMEPPDGE